MHRPSWCLRALPGLLALLLGACGAAEHASSARPTPPSTMARDTSNPAPTAPPVEASENPATPTPTLAPSEPFATGALTLEGDGRTIEMPVYVADAPALRARGLMERESLPAGTGMAFLYEQDITGTFWMRNTVLPLSIAFADADGVLFDIQDMEPCTATPCSHYGPDRPYRTALEVPQGWFADAGVTVGWRITDLPDGAAR